eukprot:c7555_g1_i1.p2 GENE.c7555_g1_i1~~c7555_g1_i1.p2  ORF type:complete len:181 (+),score=43.77 c7555_g1_i1:1146-1688(+)
MCCVLQVVLLLCDVCMCMHSMLVCVWVKKIVRGWVRRLVDIMCTCGGTTKRKQQQQQHQQESKQTPFDSTTSPVVLVHEYVSYPLCALIMPWMKNAAPPMLHTNAFHPIFQRPGLLLLPLCEPPEFDCCPDALRKGFRRNEAIGFEFVEDDEDVCCGGDDDVALSKGRWILVLLRSVVGG